MKTCRKCGGRGQTGRARFRRTAVFERRPGGTRWRSIRVAARIAQRQARIAAAPLSAAVAGQHRRRGVRPAAGRRRRRAGVSVALVAAAGTSRGRPSRRRRLVDRRVGRARRRGGHVVQEVEGGHGLALLVAEPDEEVTAANDRQPKPGGRTAQHAEAVAHGRS